MGIGPLLLRVIWSFRGVGQGIACGCCEGVFFSDVKSGAIFYQSLLVSRVPVNSRFAHMWAYKQNLQRMGYGSSSCRTHLPHPNCHPKP